MNNGELKIGDYVKIIDRNCYDLNRIYKIEKYNGKNINGNDLFQLKNFKIHEKGGGTGSFWCGYLNLVKKGNIELNNKINFEFISKDY